MKLVIQRVKHAKVEVENEIVGKIGQGFLVLLGVGPEDTKETANYLVQKLIKLRVFEDENGKMNLALKDINGELLIVSQFTLYADCTSGNRPSFTNAAKPDKANELYDELNKNGISTLLDDRDERCGVKFNDLDLIGLPFRITIGKKIGENIVEFKLRKEDNFTEISFGSVISTIKKYL